MRASDLLGVTVSDTSGRELGRVLDVRLVQDGIMLGAFAALRLEGLVIGHHQVAARLGYDRQDAHGPALIRAAVRWWTRHNRYLAWDDLEIKQGSLVARSEDLGPVPALP